MWVDELLFVLMAVALIAMAVLALIVGTKKGKGREAPPREKVVAPVPEPRAKVAHKPKVVVVQAEEEPVASIEHIVSPLPETAQAPLEEPVVIPAPEHIIIAEPEPPVGASEAPEEPPAEPTEEPSPESAALAPASEEPGPTEEPRPADLRRETESRFFDLRYENASRAPIFTEPSVLDGSPSIEDEEEEAKEPTPGIVTCPHCNSKVPQTLYCIYCGNTLTAKPAASSK